MKTIKHIIFPIFILIALAAQLTSCALLPPPQTKATLVSAEKRAQQLSRLNNWNIQGVIAVQSQQDSGSASLHWQQHQKTYSLSLFGPFGAGAVQIYGKPGLITLQNANGQTFQAASAEALLFQQTGWKLPVSSLHYWIRGLPVPGTPADSTFDQYHRLTQLSQNQWHIFFRRYAAFNGLDLPTKIELIHPELKVKLVIYHWL